MSGLSFKIQFYKLNYNSCFEFIDGLSISHVENVEKMLITTSNCDMDSSHEFQDSSPNLLENFKISGLIDGFKFKE